MLAVVSREKQGGERSD